MRRPAGTSGVPMTYQAGEKQYIVVAVSERHHEGELVALVLVTGATECRQRGLCC